MVLGNLATQLAPVRYGVAPHHQQVSLRRTEQSYLIIHLCFLGLRVTAGRTVCLAVLHDNVRLL